MFNFVFLLPDGTTAVEFGFFARQGWHIKQMQMEFRIEAYAMGLLWHAISGPDQQRGMGTEAPEAQNLVKIMWTNIYANLGKIWHCRIHHRSTITCHMALIIERDMGTGAPIILFWVNHVIFAQQGWQCTLVKFIFGVEEHSSGFTYLALTGKGGVVWERPKFQIWSKSQG